MSSPPRVLELRALAGIADDDVNEFDLTLDGVRMRVVYSPGSSSSIVLRAEYDRVATRAPTPGPARHYREGQVPAELAAIRPMNIALRPEVGTDVTAKAAGINAEVQTGDDAFDREVYVDTLAPSAVVREVLGERVRDAVRALFDARFRSVNIDDGILGVVEATCVSWPSLDEDRGEGERAARAFAALLRELPIVRPLEGAYPAHPLGWPTGILTVVGGIFLFAGMPVYLAVSTSLRPECGLEQPPGGCMVPVGVGVAAGAVLAGLAVAAASALARRFRGRSDSASRIMSFTAVVFLATWCVSGLAVALVALASGVGR